MGISNLVSRVYSHAQQVRGFRALGNSMKGETDMKRRWALVTGVLAIVGAAHADTLVYTGIGVREGAINGVDLTGQTATVTISFADGLTANNDVYTLGAITSASYRFSGAGLFTVDAPQSDLQFGSVLGFELSFFDPDFSPLGMLSGTTAGNIGLDPLNGETLPQLFSRLGDGTNIQFIQSTNFQMLNLEAGTLNGGAATVTTNIVGLSGSDVTLTLIPTPATLALLGVAAPFARRRTRN